MNGSPSSVLSLGFGSWGSVGLVVTLGLGIGAAATTDPRIETGSWQVPSVTGSWQVPTRTGSWEVPTRTGSWEDA